MSLVTWPRVWIALGLLGQTAFLFRFLIQWVTSERKKRSVVPVAFWYLSIAGGALLLAYAIYRRDPVFILGQSTGLLIYFRNLILIRRHAESAAEGAA